MLRKELAGLIAYDDVNLLHTIYKTNTVPGAVVGSALKALEMKDAKAHFDGLKKIVKKANTVEKAEKRMYPHLVCLLDRLVLIC